MGISSVTESLRQAGNSFHPYYPYRCVALRSPPSQQYKNRRAHVEFGVVIIVQVTFMFASHKSDGDLRIQAFLNKAFLWYCKAMESTEDHFRYYYTPLTEANGGAQVSLMSEGEMTRARALGMGRRGGMGNASGSHAVQRRVP